VILFGFFLVGKLYVTTFNIYIFQVAFSRGVTNYSLNCICSSLYITFRCLKQLKHKKCTHLK